MRQQFQHTISDYSRLADHANRLASHVQSARAYAEGGNFEEAQQAAEEALIQARRVMDFATSTYCGVVEISVLLLASAPTPLPPTLPPTAPTQPPLANEPSADDSEPRLASDRYGQEKAFRSWLSTVAEHDSEARTTLTRLYESYSAHSTGMSTEPMSLVTFRRKLNAAGIRGLSGRQGGLPLRLR